MTHRQRMSRDEQTLAVLSAPTMICPNCGHGIDPHGTDPGGICGVGDENRDRCPCLLSPNAICWLALPDLDDDSRPEESTLREWARTLRTLADEVRGAAEAM